jgi:uncharacterized protein (TIGR01777 family)
MQTVLITGGTGMIGQKLTNLLLDNGYEVIVLTRDATKQSQQKHLHYASWNVERNEIDTAALLKADYIIHLAGANVAEKRWSVERKKEIVESRTLSGRLVVDSLKNIQHKVQAIITASAIGWYGPDTASSLKHGFTEDWKAATDFLGTTCLQWEQSVDAASPAGIRVVKLRTGIVLSNNGGAYIEFKKPLKFGIATILGSGRQMISWIHEDDLCNMYLFALQHEIAGVYNAAAPNPVSNYDMIVTIADILRGRNFYVSVYVPSFVLKLMLGEMSIEVLKSTTVSAGKIQQAGFAFQYENLEDAVKALKVG